MCGTRRKCVWTPKNIDFCDSRISWMEAGSHCPDLEQQATRLRHLNNGRERAHTASIGTAAVISHAHDRRRDDESAISGVESVALIARFDADKCQKGESGCPVLPASQSR